MKGNSNKNNADFEDDDCEVCRLMQKGEHHYGDLAKAFAKQNAKNKLNEKNQENNE